MTPPWPCTIGLGRPVVPLRIDDPQRVVEGQPLGRAAARRRPARRPGRAPGAPRRRPGLGVDARRGSATAPRARTLGSSASSSREQRRAGRAPRRRSGSRRRRSAALGSIWRKRSSTATGPMSGEQIDQIAPMLAHGQEGDDRLRHVGQEGARRGRRAARPCARRAAASAPTWRRSSGQLTSLQLAARQQRLVANTIAGWPAACAASAWRNTCCA